MFIWGSKMYTWCPNIIINIGLFYFQKYLTWLIHYMEALIIKDHMMI